MQSVTEVAAVVNRLVVDFYNDIARSKSCLLRTAAFFDGADQNSFAVLSSEEIAELLSQILYHQAAAGGRMHNHDRHGQIHVRQRGHCWHGRHGELEILDVWPKRVGESV